MRNRVEPCLRRHKTEDDPQYNSTGYFERFGSHPGELIHFVCDEIVGGVVKTCAGNKRKDTCDQVDGSRTFSNGCHRSGEYGQHEGCDEIRDSGAGVEIQAEQIGAPCDSAGKTAEYQL